jgi:uncharacterized membrane protein
MDAHPTNASRDHVETPAWIANSVARIEGDERLDAAAQRLAPLVQRVSSGTAGAILRGEWLGHALHPLLTDFPLGCWLSAGLLDLVGGKSSRRAAQRLVGFGVLTAVPTAASGLADFGTITDNRTRRVGVVHAVGNGVVLLCYFRSWRARRAGRHLRGRLWGFTGGTLAWGTGYLGGHLSLARGAGHGQRGMTLDDTDDTDGTPEAVVDLREAARMLDVTVEQASAMVEEGLLVPADRGDDGPRFRAGDVRAVRLVGG